MFYRVGFVIDIAVQEEGSSAKRSTLYFSIERKEDFDNGWHSIHRCVLVQTPCQRGTSGSHFSSMADQTVFAPEL